MRINTPVINPPQSYSRVAPLTFEQRAFAPSLLQQQQETAQADLLAGQEALNFEYLQQDDPLVRDEISKYQQRLDDLSKGLVGKGVTNTPIRQDIVGLKRDFSQASGPQGIIGQASRNYADATNQWKEWKKNNPKASQAYQQQAKQTFFSGYKGLQDEFGQYTPFQAGNITGERDIATDAVEYFKNAGFDPAEIGNIMPDVKWIQKHDPKTGATYMGALVTTPGIAGTTNAKQLEFGLDEFVRQYTDPTTDRGLYSQIAGKSQEEVIRTLSNTANLMRDSKGGSAPKVSLQGSFVKPTTPTFDKTSGGFNPGIFPTTVVDPKAQKKLDRNMNTLGKGFSGDNFDINNIEGRNLGKELDAFLEDVSPLGTETFKVMPPYWAFKGGANVFSNWKSKSDKEKATAIWTDYKDRYSNYYDLTHSKDGDTYKSKNYNDGTNDFNGDKGFKDLVQKSEQLKTAYIVPEYNLGISKPFQNINSSTKEVRDDKGKSLTYTNQKGEGFSGSQIKKMLTASGLTDIEMPTMLDKDGNLYFELPTNKDGTDVERFTLNPEALSGDAKKAWDFVKDIENTFSDFSLSPEEMKEANEGGRVINTQTSKDGSTRRDQIIQLTLDPDPNKRSMELVTVDTYSDGRPRRVVGREDYNISDLYKLGLKGVFDSVTQ